MKKKQPANETVTFIDVDVAFAFVIVSIINIFRACKKDGDIVLFYFECLWSNGHLLCCCFLGA